MKANLLYLMLKKSIQQKPLLFGLMTSYDVILCVSQPIILPHVFAISPGPLHHHSGWKGHGP